MKTQVIFKVDDLKLLKKFYDHVKSIGLTIDENAGIKKRKTLGVKDREKGDFVSVGTSKHYDVASNFDTSNYRRKKSSYFPAKSLKSDFDEIITIVNNFAYKKYGKKVESVVVAEPKAVETVSKTRTSTKLKKTETVEKPVSKTTSSKKATSTKLTESQKQFANDFTPEMVDLAKKKLGEFRKRGYFDETIATYVIAKQNDKVVCGKKTNFSVYFGDIVTVASFTKKETKAKEVTKEKTKSSFELSVDVSGCKKTDIRKIAVFISTVKKDDHNKYLQSEKFSIILETQESLNKLKDSLSPIKGIKLDVVEPLVSKAKSKQVTKQKAKVNSPELVAFCQKEVEKMGKMKWKPEKYNVVKSVSKENLFKTIKIDSGIPDGFTLVGKLIDFV